MCFETMDTFQKRSVCIFLYARTVGAAVKSLMMTVGPIMDSCRLGVHEML